MTDAKDESPEDVRKRIGLEELTAQLGQTLGGILKESAPDLGFCLLMFNYGEGGALAYCSSAQRADMIKTLDEFREMLLLDMAAKENPA